MVCMDLRRRLRVCATAGVLGVAALAVPAVPSSAAEATCEGQPATIVGTEGADDLVGTSGPDVIVGLGGDDRIDALAGEDVVCGGAGDDTILGGRRVDRLVGGAGDDWIEPEEGDDVVVWRPGHGTDVVLSRRRDTDSAELHGTPRDDTLAVRRVHVGGRVGPALLTPRGNGVVLLRGDHSRFDAWLGEGADTMQVRGPRTRGVAWVTLYAGPPDDTGRSSADRDRDVVRWRGTRDADSVRVLPLAAGGVWLEVPSAPAMAMVAVQAGESADHLRIDGRGGRDAASYRSAPGANRIRVAGRHAHRFAVTDAVDGPATGAPSPVVQPWVGFERLTLVTKGGSDDVDLSGLSRRIPVRVFGGGGDDTLTGSPGRNRFIGNRGDDVASGGAGRDHLLGGDGADRLLGGRGDDVLDGGSGDGARDECTGGPGSDTLVGCEIERP